MIPLYPWPQFPQQNAQITPGGAASRSFWFFLQALFNRTGGDSGNADTVGIGLTAAGSAQATALVLSDDYNEVLTGSGDGVMLANLQPGQRQSVYNGTGGNVSVYPFTGGQIDADAVNAAYTLGNGKTQIFVCYKLLASGAPFYRSTQLG